MTARLHPSAAVLLLVLLSACSGGGSSHARASQPSSAAGGQPTLAMNFGGTFDARGKTTVQVTASDFRFSPSTILATPGQVLTLVVHNVSQTPHNVSDATGVNDDLAPTATKTVHVTVPASGELVFWCEYHKAAGMAGQIGPAAATAGGGTPASPSGSSGGYKYGGGY